MTKSTELKYIIIVGAGRIGDRVIELAVADGHEVVVIEKNTDLAEIITSRYDCLIINADASQPGILEEAGVKQADVLISTTNDDATNLLIMMLAHNCGVPRLLTSVRDQNHTALFEQMDIDTVESPHRLNGEYLYKNVHRPGIKDFMQLDGGAEIMEIELSKDSDLIGKTIREALSEDAISEDLIVVAIYRNGELIIPKGNSKFEGGDIVTVLSKENLEPNLIRKFSTK